jgi:hypothetical protein
MKEHASPFSARIGVLAGALLVTLLPACGDNQDDAGARDLLSKVRADEYRSWQRAPGYETRRPTNAPHGDSVDIYVNDVVAGALARAEPLPSFPQGSIIVKDGWDASDLEIVAIMEKRSEGWFWAEYDSDGDPDYSGRPDVCIDCHQDGSDYVLSFQLQ